MSSRYLYNIINNIYLCILFFLLTKVSGTHLFAVVSSRVIARSAPPSLCLAENPRRRRRRSPRPYPKNDAHFHTHNNNNNIFNIITLYACPYTHVRY